MLARVPDEFDADEFDAYAIGVEEARLVVRRGHPLLARAPARLADLAGFDWVMQPRGTPLGARSTACSSPPICRPRVGCWRRRR